jgi:hypothetical protein
MTGKLALSLALFASIASPAIAATAAAPDFGPNVLVFNPSTPPATMQAQIDKVYATQRRNNIRFHDRFTVALGRLGEISNVINNTGGPAPRSPPRHPQGHKLPLEKRKSPLTVSSCSHTPAQPHHAPPQHDHCIKTKSPARSPPASATQQSRRPASTADSRPYR